MELAIAMALRGVFWLALLVPIYWVLHRFVFPRTPGWVQYWCTVDLYEVDLLAWAKKPRRK